MSRRHGADPHRAVGRRLRPVQQALGLHTGHRRDDLHGPRRAPRPSRTRPRPWFGGPAFDRAAPRGHTGARVVHRFTGDQRWRLASEKQASEQAPADRYATHHDHRMGPGNDPVPGHRRLDGGADRRVPGADRRRSRAGGRHEPQGAVGDPPSAEHRERTERRARPPLLRPRSRGGGRDRGVGCARPRRGVREVAGARGDRRRGRRVGRCTRGCMEPRPWLDRTRVDADRNACPDPPRVRSSPTRQRAAGSSLPGLRG